MSEQNPTQPEDSSDGAGQGQGPADGATPPVAPPPVAPPPVAPPPPPAQAAQPPAQAPAQPVVPPQAPQAQTSDAAGQGQPTTPQASPVAPPPGSPVAPPPAAPVAPAAAAQPPAAAVPPGTPQAGGAPTYTYPPAPQMQQVPKSNMPLAALVLGLLSLCTGALLGIPAIIVGILGIKKANETGQPKGMAVGGIVLGIVTTIGSIIAGIVLLSAAGTVANQSEIYSELSEADAAAAMYVNTNGGSADGISMQGLESSGYVADPAWNTEVVGAGSDYCVQTSTSTEPEKVYHHSTTESDTVGQGTVYTVNGFTWRSGACPALG